MCTKWPTHVPACTARTACTCCTARVASPVECLVNGVFEDMWQEVEVGIPQIIRPFDVGWHIALPVSRAAAVAATADRDGNSNTAMAAEGPGARHGYHHGREREAWEKGVVGWRVLGSSMTWPQEGQRGSRKALCPTCLRGRSQCCKARSYTLTHRWPGCDHKRGGAAQIEGGTPKQGTVPHQCVRSACNTHP